MNALPDTTTLTRHLSRLLCEKGKGHAAAKILSRQKCIYTSTFPAEIIDIQLQDEITISLFCKYISGMEHNFYGHRGGPLYEIKIYDEVLKDIALSKPWYYGKCYIPELDETIIVLEYLADGWRVHHLPQPAFNLKLAAVWIARFHHLFENEAPSFVHVYDEAYYRLWVEKVRAILPELLYEFSWLEELCSYFLAHLPQLVDAPRTLIHGEFYPRNILVQHQIIYIVDWESAAAASGVIDLASLVDGWEEEIMEPVIEAYKVARWPNGTEPADFETLLLLAQIYLQFRWIIEFKQSWFERPSTGRQLSRLREKLHDAFF